MSGRRPEEITQNANVIRHLPARTARKETGPGQAGLDLQIDRQTEIQGIGMGVLNDGTPFLTQRGLARLCGVQNAHIGTISSGWGESPQQPRISKIKDLLAVRGISPKAAHIEVLDRGTTIYAYPDTVCLAVLEYYAFEAGANCKEEARKNFRLLAGKALQDFIYSQVGYDPSNSVPIPWKQFHDRVSLVYNSVPKGFFSIFKEIADMIVTLGQAGLHLDESFLPDISVGQHRSRHWTDNGFDQQFGDRLPNEHNYPEYFPQARSNPQFPWCYPNMALGEFRRWFQDDYVGCGRFKTYIEGKARKGELSVSFVQLAIAAYEE